MAIGPRLDLRQSQSLVMTPQLRQAIKLLQFSNVEVTSFIEEELERNPLLERDESSDMPAGERPAPDQVVPAASSEPRDVAEAASSEQLAPAASSALDDGASESYDPGGASDGVTLSRNSSQSFDDDDRTIDDFAEAGPTLREHLGEQLRLSFGDPTDRLIGAYLIALLEPSGRLSVASTALAQPMGCDVAQVEAVRPRMLPFYPPALFPPSLPHYPAPHPSKTTRPTP